MKPHLDRNRPGRDPSDGMRDAHAGHARARHQLRDVGLIDADAVGEVALPDAAGRQKFGERHARVDIPTRNVRSTAKYSRQSLPAARREAHTQAVQRLKQIRKARGLSQKKLAEAVGVEQGTISRIERGYTSVSLTMIMNLADVLQVYPAELFAMPELHERVLSALERADPARRAEALQVLSLFLGERPDPPK